MGAASLVCSSRMRFGFFFFQAEDGIRDKLMTGVQTCALPICEVPIGRALDTFADPAFDFLCDGAPADLTIREDFPLPALERVVARFAKGKAGNMLTITARSEERRVGKEGRPRGWPRQLQDDRG